MATTTRRPRRRKFDANNGSRSVVNARYDVARTTKDNASLWTGADALSAAQANNPQVRKTLRERARYEVANNSYAKGLVRIIADDTVGAEVQLQLGDTDLAEQVEKDFAAWAHEVKLWQKCRTMIESRITDGEVFAMAVTNRNLNHNVKLDLNLIECDMIEGFWTGQTAFDRGEVDGIRLDQNGNPTAYRLLEEHPGDYRFGASGGKAKGRWVDARYIMHLFRRDRPGQIRGVSELTPALNLFGLLRKYTIAVLEAAQRAAEISGVMETTLCPDQLSAELADPVTVLQAERNAIVSLPEGWVLRQLKAEQPVTTYKMFKDEIINEIARCLNAPFNIAAGNSSGYNYASGRLDHQSYDRTITIDRSDLSIDFLDCSYEMWLDEYSKRKSLSLEQIRELHDHEWHFAGRDHVDPAKEANADNIRLANRTLTYAAYYAKRGKDWKREIRQGIREQIEKEIMWNEAREQAGLPPAPYLGRETTTTETETMFEPDESEESEGLEKWA